MEIKEDRISNLITSLIKAQKEFKPLIKGSTNPFFKTKYADLEACWNSVKEALLNNGLTIYSTTHISEGKNVLDTYLVHESGESIHSEYLIIPVKNDPQSEGSALTYARRYSLSALLTLVSESDDDGNAGSKSKTDTKSSPRGTQTPTTTTGTTTESKDDNLITRGKYYHVLLSDNGIVTEEQRHAWQLQMIGKESFKEFTIEDIEKAIDILKSNPETNNSDKESHIENINKCNSMIELSTWFNDNIDTINKHKDKISIMSNYRDKVKQFK